MSKKPAILFRKDLQTEEEMRVAGKYFPIYEFRNSIPKNSFVIGRYSVLPYYRELSSDLFYSDSQLINSYFEHSYIADLGSWYEDLKKYTPETISFREFPMYWGPSAEGSFVLKGQTNGRKNQWRTKMFAQTAADVTRVGLELMDDGLVGDQTIYVRKYVPLKKYLTSISGQPVVDEYRFFMYKDKILASAFYWSSHITDIIDMGITPDVGDVPVEFINKLSNIIKEQATFYVMDVARTQSGEWILIELNDGQMSGLSEVDPDTLYKNLRRALEEDGYEF
jgi:hypothetical protein